MVIYNKMRSKYHNQYKMIIRLWHKYTYTLLRSLSTISRSYSFFPEKPTRGRGVRKLIRSFLSAEFRQGYWICKKSRIRIKSV